MQDIEGHQRHRIGKQMNRGMGAFSKAADDSCTADKGLADAGRFQGAFSRANGRPDVRII
jgi:hypothetical protein